MSGLQEHRAGAGPASSAGAAPSAAAPGKRTLTQALTGVPVVDQGTLCEREPPPGAVCVLEKDDRTRFLGVIGQRAGIVGANVRDALQDSRIDVLTNHKEGWGPLAEFLFYAATGPMIAGAVGVVKAMEKYAHVADHVQATLTNSSRSLRKALQGEAAAAAGPQRASKARFLELVRDAIGPWQATLVEDSTYALDDAGLIALKDALAPEHHSVGHYKERIADMLQRFDDQRLEAVGVTSIYRHGELQWIGRGRVRRLVLLEDHGLHNLTGSGGPMPRDLVRKKGADGKPIVVDRDLEPMALALFRERTGREPLDVDVEDAIAAGGELAQMGQQLLLEILTFGMTS